MFENSEQSTVEEIIETNETESSEEVVSSGRKKVVNKYTVTLVAIITVLFLVYLLLPAEQLQRISALISKDNHLFYWMLLVGFLAEIVAGSMGMGYGVICTTILLILNIPPAVISASIHSAESFTSAAGTISHWQLGNINKKLVKVLAIPAIIGAIIGAIALSLLSEGEKYAKMTKPFLAVYTMYLGYTILRNAFVKKDVFATKKKVNITTLGLFGGFIDSFGGGGWGPLVTGTFIKNGRTPRYVVGSSTMAKFILTVASAITFIFTIGIHHWNIVAGLLIGGIITAPFSAMLTAKLPREKMFVTVGIVVIVCSCITLYRFFFL
jgi:uncharacterized membrane protein YfcA